MAGILQRAYNVPTSWMPPAPKGVFDHRNNTITMIFANPGGNGNPRNMGKRVVNPTLRTQMFVG